MTTRITGPDCPCGGRMVTTEHEYIEGIPVPVRIACPRCGLRPIDLLERVPKPSE